MWQHQRLQLMATASECRRVSVSNVRTSVGNVPDLASGTAQR
jgi:hypothetical protein